MSIQEVRPIWHVYVRKGMALIPDVAQTEAGYFLDVPPVRVAELRDLQAMASAIEQAMAAGNPRVPTPTRAAFPEPVILRPARVKNWNTFEKRGACFTILRGGSELEIAESGRNDSGDWVDAPALSQRLPEFSSAMDIAKRIVERARQRTDLT
jgi:hypothetical protein